MACSGFFKRAAEQQSARQGFLYLYRLIDIWFISLLHWHDSVMSLCVQIKTAKVLCVGAGGIGCELLKTLALTGFEDIELVRLLKLQCCVVVSCRNLKTAS